ncbi:MAG: TlpA family protein disulfide reductase [Firmicutes bacterium]|nr:TlpA family protein disulfide reductase [Bacillota bacterium]
MDRSDKNKAYGKKLKNTIYWVILFVLVVLLSYNLYNLYNRYAGSTSLKLMPGQITDKGGSSIGENSHREEDNSSNSNDNYNVGENDKRNNEGNNGENRDESNVDKEEKIAAPDFELEDLEGNKVKLSEYKGKIVILNFWALWCPYCIKEMPDLDRVNKKLLEGDDAVILTVNLQDSIDKVKDYIRENGFSIPVLMDTDGNVGNMYNVTGIPITYIIDKEGAFYGYIPGATNEKALLEIIEKIN